MSGACKLHASNYYASSYREMWRALRRTGNRYPSCSARDATTIPACHPGARPRAGSCTSAASRSAETISHAMIELEFHISPACSSSRPQTGVGTDGTNGRLRRAAANRDRRHRSWLESYRVSVAMRTKVSESAASMALRARG